MNILVTNVSSEAVFLTGPYLNLEPGEAKPWTGLTLSDLDSDSQLKGLVLAGKVTVAVTASSTDAAFPTTGSLSVHGLMKSTVAELPTGFEGRVAFATNGRRTGQGGGAGTGVPVYYSAGAWRVFFDDTAVAT